MVSFECYSILQKENDDHKLKIYDIMSAREQSGLVHFANGE